MIHSAAKMKVHHDWHAARLTEATIGEADVVCYDELGRSAVMVYVVISKSLVCVKINSRSFRR